MNEDSDGSRPKEPKIRYHSYSELPTHILAAIDSLGRANRHIPFDGKLTATEAGIMTYTDPKIIASYFPYFTDDLYQEKPLTDYKSRDALIESVIRAVRDGVKEKFGREMRNPMSGAERSYKGWWERRMEDPHKDEMEYDEFFKAFRRYRNGRDVAGIVNKRNPYMQMLYMVASSPRTINSLKRMINTHRPIDDALESGARVSWMHRYNLVDRLDDRSRLTYEITDEGKAFLYALMPALKGVLENKRIPEESKLKRVEEMLYANAL